MREKQAMVDRARQALMRQIAPLVTSPVTRPNAGWLKASREALGMSRAQMAARMGVSPSRIGQLEAAEKTNRIKLDTLARAAEAMNCTLVYAIVPNAGSYEAAVAMQANDKTLPLVARTDHTMALENQQPTADGARRVTQAMVDELVESGQLWDL